MSPLPRIKPAHISDDEWKSMQDAEAQREQKLDDNIRRAQMRLHAIGVDDGRGFCKHCSAVLVVEMVDGQEHKGHPLGGVCIRPARCAKCGGEMAPRDIFKPITDDTRTCATCVTAARAALDDAKRAAAAPPEMKPVRRQRSLFGERDDDEE